MDEMQKREKKWRRTQSAGFLFPGLLALAIIALVVFFCTPLSDLPIRNEKIIRTMEGLSCPITDSTEENREKWSVSTSLACSRTAETDGLRIDFFEAANESGCGLIEGKLSAEIDNRWSIADHYLVYNHRRYKIYGAGRDGHYMLYIRWVDKILYLEWDIPHTPAVVEFMKDLNLNTRKVEDWE